MASAKARRTAQPVLNRPQGVAVVPFSGPRPGPLPGALELPIAHLEPDPDQPRRDWAHAGGEERLAELTDSIREFGVLQPLLVAEVADERAGAPRYRIIAGNRRFVAAQRAGLPTVPVVLRAGPATEIRILQLTENLQRQDLKPLDEARAFKELQDLQGLTPPQLAARLHVSDQHIRNRLRLLEDQTLADAVERRQIAASVARQIQQLPEAEQPSFRQRVRAGERLQMNDLAAVRARLAAEGVEHPRRSPRPQPPAPAAPFQAAPMAAHPDTSVQPNSQTVFAIVPPSDEPATSPGPPAEPGRAPAAARDDAGHAGDRFRDSPLLARWAGAPPDARRLVLDLLRHGAARGLTCAILLGELDGDRGVDADER